MTRQALLRSFRSFLDRLYVLQRFKLFIGSRACPPSTPVQPQQLRRQIVALVQKYAANGAGAFSADAPRWKLEVGRSLITSAGDGVFLRGASVPPHTLLTLYPGDLNPCRRLHVRQYPRTYTASGTIYMPWQRNNPGQTIPTLQLRDAIDSLMLFCSHFFPKRGKRVHSTAI